MQYLPRWTPGLQCPKNEAVICSDHSKCKKCGWNPEVSEKRLAAVIEELKQKRRAAVNGKNN